MKEGVKTSCPYCGVGCGLILSHENDHRGDRMKVFGDVDHPSSRGDLCIKPIHLPRVLGMGRLDTPLFRQGKNNSFKPKSWQDAVDLLALKLKTLKKDEVYFYLSGQMSTEECYVFNKFAKGAMGTNNIDANSRLCMASAVTAHKMAFGSDGPLGCYDDIDTADTFIFIGSNAAVAHPVLFKRVLKRKKEGAKIITIDPIPTETAKKSDIFISIKPATDTIFLNAVFRVCVENGWVDEEFIAKHTNGYEETQKRAFALEVRDAAAICEVGVQDILTVARYFARSKFLISFWCQGLNQSINGTHKNLSLINLHLLTGRTSERGYPFSLTGQPNAMGGRETGYLSNGLPGYRDVRVEEDRQFMQRFWSLDEGQIQSGVGPTATEAVKLIEDGKIKLLWIVCTNPMVTMPNLSRFLSAVSNEELFVVVQDAYINDAIDYANLALPAAQWGEKDGTRTNSERVVSLFQPFRQPPPAAKPDWQIVCEVAKAMGFGGFEFQSAREIFDEYKMSTKDRLCDMSDFEYESLPRRWGKDRLYENSRFSYPDGKAKFIPTNFDAYPKDDDKYDFILTSGRIKEQWHTMTRTGKVIELMRQNPHPFCMISFEDAQIMGVMPNDTITIKNDLGVVRVRAVLADMKPKRAFVYFGYPLAFDSPINILFSDDVCPLSKQPELKYAKVSITGRNRKKSNPQTTR